MSSLAAFILLYLFGGLTFIPLLLGIAFAVLPKHPTCADSPVELDDDESGDHGESDSHRENFQRNHELDVAAGYFAVCREYVPGGQNGKPPERTTPAGEVIAEESPSVYQSMYRSIFDRKQVPTIDPSRTTNGKPVKKANNVFYTALRHHHLMLFDSSEQVVVRHVISLNHHDISIYGGGNDIPEGELWLKRNAIRLDRKPGASDAMTVSKPFFLFSENCSEKEDFYFALLQSQERGRDDEMSPPRAQQFELKDIISLVQKLHSSEEHLHTRWLNALIGRIFLATYKTKAVEDYVRTKFTKKIARITKPAFLSGIILQKIDMGHSAPYITNPRLRDLNVDGECCAEADLKYSGNFRLEVAATARIDLGTRFKAREVNLVLAVVVKKLEGHMILRLKPPPSNRLWVSFEKMPNIEMRVEPVVSSRQITYSIILRAIESRIREVVAETIVLPHFDDIPFTRTTQQHFRGGIWMEESSSERPSHRNKAPPNLNGEDPPPKSKDTSFSLQLLPRDERSLSTPLLVDQASSPGLPHGLTRGNRTSNLVNHTETQMASGTLKKAPSSPGLSYGLTTGQKKQEMPKAIRTLSSASSGAASPVLSTDNANTEVSTVEAKAKHQSPTAASAMIAISTKSQPTSPINTPIGSPPQPPSTFTGNESGVSEGSPSASEATTIYDSQHTYAKDDDFPHPPSPRETELTNSFSDTFGSESFTSKASLTPRLPQYGPDKGKALAAIGATAVAARKWGWNVLNRNINEQKAGGLKNNTDRVGLFTQPMGRGRPIPFPNPVTMPKRKQLPPPLLPDRGRQAPASEIIGAVPPPLPHRHDQRRPSNIDENNGMLVVEAPPASGSESPSSTQEEFVFHMRINAEEDEEDEQPSGVRRTHPEDPDDDLFTLKTSSTESKRLQADDGEHHVPHAWTAAQEGGQAQSIWAEESSPA